MVLTCALHRWTRNWLDNDGRLELLLGDSVRMVGFPEGLTRLPQEILIQFEDRIGAIRET